MKRFLIHLLCCLKFLLTAQIRVHISHSVKTYNQILQALRGSLLFSQSFCYTKPLFIHLICFPEVLLTAQFLADSAHVVITYAQLALSFFRRIFFCRKFRYPKAPLVYFKGLL